MLKYLFVGLLMCGSLGSCVKDPIKGLGRASAEWNGEKWEGRVSFFDSKRGDNTLSITLQRYVDNDYYNPAETLIFHGVKKSKERQQLINQEAQAPDDYPQFSMHINDSYDASKGRFTLVVSDSANNYLRIISEKDEYTRKLVGEFSVTVVKVGNNPKIADYPDTIRI